MKPALHIALAAALGVVFLGTPPAPAQTLPIQGYIDAHNHLFSNEAFGGKLLCGKVFDAAGPAAALVDCADHQPDGSLAWFENFTRYGSPIGTHNPAGYPTLQDWPAHNSLTHQQNYYSWIERAWRGGLRIMVNDLVTNRQLCDIYPLKDRPCDEMTSIRLQAQLTTQLEAFIDAQYGGAGKGWFRIARSAAQARDAIAAGKLAVILGVETSEPFGCRQILTIPQCSAADIDRGLDELYALGVRSMFVCHKFDNALCGVRFDSGTIGNILNLGNFVGTGQFWKATTCTGPHHDNTISPAGVIPDELARLLPPGISLPVYPPAPHCNVNGLTALGEHMVRGMIARKMIIEVDHMSAKAADQTLDILESVGYPGVISSHSWTAPGYLPRIYALGGMITQYGHQAQEFVDEWRRTLPLRQQYGVPGYGVGIDANGFGVLPAPRAGSAVQYPFTTFDGASMDRLTTGARTWDYNRDGMAHYGLMPDWIEDMRRIAGAEIVADLAGGAPAYLRTLAATEAYVAPTDVALGRSARASSWSLLAGLAVDGNRSTRWFSDWNANQWIRVDLGSVRSVKRVALDWEAAYARSYRVEVSNDAATWRTVATITDGQGGLDAISFAPTQARYVRMQGVQPATQYGYSLWSFSVYG